MLNKMAATVLLLLLLPPSHVHKLDGCVSQQPLLARGDSNPSWVICEEYES